MALKIITEMKMTENEEQRFRNTISQTPEGEFKNQPPEKILNLVLNHAKNVIEQERKSNTSSTTSPKVRLNTRRKNRSSKRRRH